MKFLWTTIHVKNLEESINFYSNLVDFKVMNRFKAGNDVEIAFMGIGEENETHIELLEDKSKKDFSFGEDISIGVKINSIEEMIEKVKLNNVPMGSPIIEVGKGRFFFVKDPNGVNVQFFEEK
ncbi:VOC family protein [uncultured Clostridium sp.]|uniref:VOC family protein n=1 Tax=uncultured Clostridium sp. TaxID=59620 RepID=UPI002630297F|nr:VOC family protein [uncultured Clostridium sp.]